MFLYALRAPESKRQYRKRLKVVLNYLKNLDNLVQDDRLLGDEELSYFAVYVKKAYAIDAVIDYIKFYDFRLTDGR
jgi:hypothetical protein